MMLRIWRPSSWLAVAALGAVPIWTFAHLISVFQERFTFPADLEWCEGGTLYHAWRLLHGLPLYGPADSVFAPFPYPPVHTWALAGAGLFGLDYGVGRMLSILSFLLLCAVVFHAVAQHGSLRSVAVGFGLLALSLFAVDYPTVGCWYDLVRVDTFQMALVVVALGLAGGPRHTRAQAIGLCIALTASVFTKQTGAFWAAWIILFLLVTRWRYGLAVGGGTAALCGALLGILQWRTDGQFWNWIVAYVARHHVETERLARGIETVADAAPYLLALPVLFAVALWRKTLDRRSLLWVGALVCAVPASFLPYAKQGGYANNLMPILLLGAPTTALVALDLLSSMVNPRRARLAAYVLLAAGAVWLLVRAPRWDDFRPHPALWKAAENLDGVLANLEGNVVVPASPFLAVQSGHAGEQWHEITHMDATLAGFSASNTDKVLAIQADWVVVGGGTDSDLPPNYVLHSLIPVEARVPTQCGLSIELKEIWKRVDSEARSGQ